MAKTADRVREWRRKRRAAGVCRDCGRPAVPGQTRCGMHQEAAAERMRRLRRERREAGRCATCAGPALPGLTLCDAHQQQERARKKRVTPEQRRRQWKANYERAKERILDHYGRVCACCGEHRREFLTIDHSNGDGAAHRRAISRARTPTGQGNPGTNMTWWLITHGFPEGFRTLCFNCNCARGFRGYCPHEHEREEKGSTDE
jgi:hypothetical protein